MQFEQTKTVKTKRQHVKSLGGFAVNNKFIPANTIVEVSAREALELIQRGKAVDATAGEVTAAGDNIEVAPNREPLNSWVDA